MMFTSVVYLLVISTAVQEETPTNILDVSEDFSHFLVEGKQYDTFEIWTAKKRSFEFDGDVAAFETIDGKTRIISAMIRSLTAPKLIVTIRDLDNNVLSERRFSMNELVGISPALFGYKIKSIHATSNSRVIIDFSNNSLLEFEMDSDTFNYIYVLGSKIAVYTEKEVNSLSRISRDRLIKHATNSAIDLSLGVLDDHWVIDAQSALHIYDDDPSNSEDLDRSSPSDPSGGAFAVVKLDRAGLKSSTIFRPVFQKETASFSKTAGVTRIRTTGETWFLRLEWVSKREIKFSRIGVRESIPSKSTVEKTVSIRPGRDEAFTQIATEVGTSESGKNFFIAVKSNKNTSVYKIDDQFKASRVLTLAQNFNSMRVLKDRVVLIKNASINLQFFKLDDSQLRDFTLGE